MGITENEYREFLSTFGFYLNKQKEWLNDHVLNNGRGVHLPMGTDEIKLSLEFLGVAAHIFVEIMPDAGEWLETEWWDKEYKEEKGVKEHDDADWDWMDGETWDEKDVDDDVEEEKFEEEEKKRNEKYLKDRTDRGAPEPDHPDSQAADKKKKKDEDDKKK